MTTKPYLAIEKSLKIRHFFSLLNLSDSCVQCVYILVGDAHLELKDLEGVIVIELDSLDNQGMLSTPTHYFSPPHVYNGAEK